MKKLLSVLVVFGLLVSGSVSLAADGDPLLEPLIPTDLDEAESASDNDILTYNLAGTNFSWQTPAELNLLTTSANFEDLNDVNSMTEAQGDIVVRTGATQWDRLALGTQNYALVAGATDPAWTQLDLSHIAGGTAGANTFDFGSATAVEIPNSATPTVALGQIAIDTTIANHKGLIVYDHTGSEDMTVIAIPTADLVATDNYIIKYDLGNTKFTMEADEGGTPGAFPQGDVTIATGQATIGTDNWIQLTGEGDAADALTELVANALGDIIVLQLETGKAYTITVTDGSYMVLQNGQNFLLDDPDDMLIGIITTLGANDVFTEISRASNS